MQTEEEILKKNLQAAIEARNVNFDKETVNIDGNTYSDLYTLLQELIAEAKNVAEDKEALTTLQNKLATYDANLKKAQAAKEDEAYSEMGLAEFNQAKDELDRSYKDSAEYLLMMSQIAFCSATDRLQIPQLESDAEALKQQLAKLEQSLNQIISTEYRNNAARAEKNTRADRERLDKAKALAKKVEMSKENFNKSEAEQKEFGYYYNKELATDAAMFLDKPEQAQVEMEKYFGRGPAQARVDFEISSNVGTSLRHLNKTGVYNNQLRFIPSTIKDDRNNLTRCAMVQYHDEHAKTFRSIIRLEDAPKNIKCIRHLFTTIPGKAMMMFAHDVVENHRMMNKFYPSSGLTLNLSGAPAELAEAIILYCKFMKYAPTVKGVSDHTSDSQLALLNKKLGAELREIAVSRLELSSPVAAEETKQETIAPAVRQMGRA